jgi:hypothetical protein
LAGKPERRDHLEDLVVDKRVILQKILHTYDGKVRIGLIWLRIWGNDGSSIKDWEYLWKQ